MQDELRQELTALFRAARDADELETLVEGLLTPREVEEIVLRWRLMQRLIRGETQRDISQELGISLGKIARGSRLLKYGIPGFGDFVSKLEQRLGGDVE